MKSTKNLRNKVGLELVQINIETAIETKRSGDAKDDLCDESVKVGEAGLSHVEVLLADLVDGLVINL